MKNPKHRAEAAANWFLAGKVLRKEDLVEVVAYEIKKALRQQHDRSDRQKCTLCGDRMKPCGVCEDCYYLRDDCQFCD